MIDTKSGVSVRALILAAGKEFGALECFGCHAMIPMVGRPLIWYPLNLLQQHSFVLVEIVCTKSVSSNIRSFVEKEFPSIKPILHTVDGDSLNASDRGSLEIFRYLNLKVDDSSEILILPCDFIGNSSLIITKSLNEHWRRNAVLTAILSRPGTSLNTDSNDQPTAVPGGTKSSAMYDTVIIDNESRRLLYARSHGSLNKDFDLRQHIAMQHRSITGFTDVTSGNAYIMRGILFKFLVNQRKWRSFHEEAIPYVIENQRDFIISSTGVTCDSEDLCLPSRKNSTKRRHASAASNLSQTDTTSDFPNILDPDGLSKLRYEFQSDAFEHPGDFSFCCGYFADPESINWRVSSVQCYVQTTNTLIAQSQNVRLRHPTVKLHQRCSVGSETYIGSESSVGERSKIKKCVIGENCVVKQSVKIIATIMMDNVTIDDGSSLSNCIIGNGAKIGSVVDLKDCIITPEGVIPNGTKGCGQILPEDYSGGIF